MIWGCYFAVSAVCLYHVTTVGSSARAKLPDIAPTGVFLGFPSSDPSAAPLGSTFKIHPTSTPPRPPCFVALLQAATFSLLNHCDVPSPVSLPSPIHVPLRGHTCTCVCVCTRTHSCMHVCSFLLRYYLRRTNFTLFTRLAF